MRTRSGLRYTTMDQQQDIVNSERVQVPDSAPGTTITTVIHPSENTQSGNTQSAPKAEDPLQQLVMLLSHLSPRSTPPPIPIFRGLLTEDPQEYLNACEEHFKNAVTRPEQCVSVAAAALQQGAALWFKPYLQLGLTWPDFKNKFLKRYAGPEATVALRTSLYGDKQGKEDVEIFLLKKIKLFNRIQPDATPSEIIPMLTTLMNPALKPFMRRCQFASLDEFVDYASTIEKDVKEEAAVSRKASEQREPKCHHCPGHHFHRDCPVLQRQMTTQPQPENWRRAGENLATPPALQ